MANTKIDSIKFSGSTAVYDIDLPTTATPTIAGLSVTGSSILNTVAATGSVTLQGASSSLTLQDCAPLVFSGSAGRVQMGQTGTDSRSFSIDFTGMEAAGMQFGNGFDIRGSALSADVDAFNLTAPSFNLQSSGADADGKPVACNYTQSGVSLSMNGAPGYFCNLSVARMDVENYYTKIESGSAISLSAYSGKLYLGQASGSDNTKVSLDVDGYLILSATCSMSDNIYNIFLGNTLSYSSTTILGGRKVNLSTTSGTLSLTVSTGSMLLSKTGSNLSIGHLASIGLNDNGVQLAARRVGTTASDAYISMNKDAVLLKKSNSYISLSSNSVTISTIASTTMKPYISMNTNGITLSGGGIRLLGETYIPGGITMGTDHGQAAVDFDNFNTLTPSDNSLMHYHSRTGVDDRGQQTYRIVESTEPPITSEDYIQVTELKGHYWMLVPRIRGTTSAYIAANFRSSSVSVTSTTSTIFYKVCYLDCLNTNSSFGYFAYYSSPTAYSPTCRTVDLMLTGSGDIGSYYFYFESCTLIKIV